MDSSMSVDEDTLGGTEIALPPPIAAPAVGGSDGKAGGGRVGRCGVSDDEGERESTRRGLR